MDRLSRRTGNLIVTVFAFAALFALGCGGSAGEAAEPEQSTTAASENPCAGNPCGSQPAEMSADEQMAQLVTDCANSAEARQARHAATPLYQRLGGDEKVLAMTTKIVELHNQNPKLTKIMEGVDAEVLAKSVAQFISAGTGGGATYTGRDMKSAHAHLGITNETFLAAGGDVAAGMKAVGAGDEEIEEMLCILVSMKDDVIVK